MPSISAQIKEQALALGFAKVGIARSEHLSAESVHLTEWLRRGFHGTMDWMERNQVKRSNPGAVLEGASSVIAVAMNYFSDVRHSEDTATGKISRYAWGDDYHLVMTKRLAELESFVQKLAPQAKTRRYVDTGPVMDKVWAAKAGLGWQGKHTNLITKEVGSWVFLGEILTDLELRYDEPVADACGTCTACIEACPTDAIVEPYVLDSTKCISYLTIEHHGEIPDSLKPQLERWVYGCDICQDVCPWNSFQKASSETAYAPREANIAPRLEELAAMTQEEFSARFRKSPVKRTKRSGLIRNARAVLDGEGSSKGKP